MKPSCTASLATSRSRSPRAAARCARCRAVHQPRATICVLSVDIELQKIAERAFGDRRGALIAIEPKTGDVLAFVAKPTFDLEPVCRRYRSKELGRAEQ